MGRLLLTCGALVLLGVLPASADTIGGGNDYVAPVQAGVTAEAAKADLGLAFDRVAQSYRTDPSQYNIDKRLTSGQYLGTICRRGSRDEITTLGCGSLACVALLPWIGIVFGVVRTGKKA